MLARADDAWTMGEAAHLLKRAGFGGSPSEIETLHALGRKKAVESLVSPAEPLDAFPVPPWAVEAQAVSDMQERMEQRKKMQAEIASLPPEQAEIKKKEFNQTLQRMERMQGLEAQGWWFRRILKTTAPLREKMTLFWHDHFATSIQKVKAPVLLIWQNELFRSKSFGSFRELTQAILFDPAMVLYLDVQNSKKGQPNENFPREVMELFTLGEGHYSEQDIHEAAKAFTGYQLTRSNGKVFHNPRQWDATPKTVFGKTGPFDGQQVIDLIFQQAEPARLMVRKIWDFFVGNPLDEHVVEDLAASFRSSDYQMAPLLNEIFLSSDFYAPAVIRSQIKCPVQYLVELLKELEITEPPNGFPLVGQQQLGQTLFMPPNVAGWDWGKAWINTNTLLSRYNLAGYLTKGSADAEKMVDGERNRTPGMAPGPKALPRKWPGPDYEKITPRPLRENPAALVDALIQRFFQGPVPTKARESFIDFANAKKGIIFTNREVAELCHLMLSTPYYQLT